MKTQPISLHVFSALTGAAILSFFPQASAASLYWDGNTTTAGAGNTTALLNKIWGTDSMWNTDSTGGAGGSFTSSTTSADDLFFVAGPSATSGNVAYTVTVSGAQVANSLNFQAQGTTTISGGTSITLGSGGINKGQFAYDSTAQGAVTISTAMILADSQTWTNNSTVASGTAGAGTLSVTGGVNLGANTLTIDGTSITNFGSTANFITGTGGLIKNGNGVLILSAGGATPAHNYSGGTTINGGVVRIQSATAYGTGNLTINSGVLESYYGTSFTRTLGSGVGQAQILGGVSGFSEQGSGSNVTFNNSAAFEVVWGATNEASNALSTGFFNPSTFVLQANTVNAGKSITFTNLLDLNGTTRTIQVNQGSTTLATMSGVIRTSSGTAGLIKEGVGTLNLSAANTYNGGTTVSEGTLSASTSASRLGSNTVGNDIAVSAGARLLLNNVANVGNNQTITLNNTGSSLSVLGLAYNGLPTAAVTFGSDTGVLAINTTYNTNLTSTLSGKSIFLGSTSSGTFNGGASAIAAGTGNIYRLGGGGGTLNINGGANVLTGNNSVVFGSTATNGGGTVVISGSQDYTGGATLNAGTTLTMAVGTYGGFGSGTLTINGGAFRGPNTTSAITISNDILWNGNLVLGRAGGGTPVFTFDGNVTLDGGVGTSGSGAEPYSMTFNGNIGEATVGSSLSLAATGTGSVFTFNGQNTFTGGMNTNSKALVVGGSGYLGGGNYAGAISSATFAYNSSAYQILSGTNNVTGVTTVSAGTLQFAKQVSLNSGTTGNWTAAKINVKSGATFAVNVDSAGTDGFDSAKLNTLLTNISVASAATSGLQAGSILGFDTSTATGGTFTQGNLIANSTGVNGGVIGLTKLGAGTLILDKANSYTGATSVTNGTLVVNGNIASSSLTTVASGATIGGSGTVGVLTVSSGAFINPGNSPGILNTGDYTQVGTYNAEITGIVAGTEHDQINVTGTVDITGGSLTTVFSAGTYAANNLIFILLNDGAEAITGTYTSLAQDAVVTSYGGYDWQISYNANYTGGTNTYNGGNDIALFAVAVIPEPRSALLVCLGALLLLRRRR
jgi:fibronectin-binding autotransporter adhesin